MQFSKKTAIYFRSARLGLRTLTKILMVMKLMVFFMVLSLAASAVEGIAQQRITMNEKDITLRKVFALVEQQTGISVAANEKFFANTKPVTVAVSNMGLEDFLNLVLKDQPLMYRLAGNTIILKRKPEKKTEDGSNSAINDDIQLVISGFVKDAEGNPLSGATITNRTARSSTSSTHAGRFSINAKTGDIVAVSYIGYLGISVRIDHSADGTFKAATVQAERQSSTPDLEDSGNNASSHNPTISQAIASRVVIEASSLSLTFLLLKRLDPMQEVVVKTNYFSSTKRLSTSNISKITSKEIGNQPVVSPLLALQGRVPGLEITMSSNATPGVAPSIRIRGNNSLLIGGKTGKNVADDGNFPLYVIDGVPVNPAPIVSTQANLILNTLSQGGFDPLSTINTANIESIEILKDADATAIYGSRGANGVILITTKQGAKSSDRINFDFNAYNGVGKIAHKMKLLNTQQYIAMRNEALAQEGVLMNDYDYDLKYWDQTHYTDWQEVLLGGDAGITDIQGAVSSNNKKTSFRIGGGFHKETLIFPGEYGFYRISGSTSINHMSTNQRFKINLNTNYGFDRNKLFPGGSGGGLVISALTLPPNAPKLYNENGTLNWEIHDVLGTTRNTWDNPLASQQNKHVVTTHNLTANANIGYDILPGLSVQTNFGYSNLGAKENSTNTRASNSPTLSVFGSAILANTNRSTWIVEPKLFYSKTLVKQGFDVTVGGTLQKATTSFLYVTGSDYTSDILLNSLNAAGRITINADEFTEYKYASVYGRVGYNWMQKYLLNLTARRDGSSRFGPGKQFGNFWSVGMGWIFSEEPFVHTSRFLTFGKIRGSYGVTGSDATGDYRYYNLYTVLSSTSDGQRGFVPNALYNPDFAWETTKKLEVALELGLLENRLGLEISWYLNRSSNQLVDYTLPATTGFPSVLKNFDATVKNTGLETVLWAKPIYSKQWKWNISFNISLPRNKLERFDGIENSPYASVFRVGSPLTVKRLYNYTGINQQTGLYEFTDENKDGIINNLDYKLVNNPTDRKYYGGLTNGIQYKNFELSIHLQYSKQGGSRFMTDMPGRSGVNQPRQVMDRWFAPGDQTDIQRFSVFPPALAFVAFQNAKQSTYNQQDASFIRVKSLSFTYMLPTTVIHRLRLQQASLFIQAQNLLSFTSYYGLDPETGNGLPPLRMISGGVQIRL